MEIFGRRLPLEGRFLAKISGAGGRRTGARVGTDGVWARLDADADRCRPTAESFVNPAKSLALGL
ncbi:hypothetical protein AB0B83_16275, partial [Micromonospora sp. NPDC049060]|uniref:hypothetical protein n=1 Tax=Micromonospora sp. NPDC049060 TaxID=3154828 RepID=UPI0034076753